MKPVFERIDRVAKELHREGQELSPTLIMWQFCNQTMDDELKAWNTDIVDVAEKVVFYMESLNNPDYAKLIRSMMVRSKCSLSS